MHENHRAAMLREDGYPARIIAGADVVDDIGSRLESRTAYPRVAGVDGDKNIRAPAKIPDHRDHPIELFIR